MGQFKAMALKFDDNLFPCEILPPFFVNEENAIELPNMLMIYGRQFDDKSPCEFYNSFLVFSN